MPIHPHLTAGVGALARYIVVEASSVVIKPSAISLEQAAGFGVSGCTAPMLIVRAELKARDRVCVNGASGGIGAMVVQLAVGSNGG
jgi:NADPH:quinone reductase-like Zn-dependent oxidoreductase